MLKSAVGGYGISFPLCAADFQFLPLPSQRAATIRFSTVNGYGRNAVASYICIANCAILFALDLVLRRPETSATKGDCVQCPIGWWTGSDWTADGIRSDGGRNLIGRRTESDRMADATKGQKLRLRHEKRYGERHTLL